MFFSLRPDRIVTDVRLKIFSAAALLLLLTGCKTDLLHRLPEGEAAQIVAVLQEHGIEASKVLDMEEGNLWKITVPRHAASQAFALLSDYKLPRASDRRMQDVFNESRLVLSPMEEQALYLEALQGEIAHTLEAIEGVIAARVHLVQPRKDLVGRPISQAKASVVVEYRLDRTGLGPIHDAEIQLLVANAVPDLEAAQVAVVQKAAKQPRMEPARREHTGPDLVSVGPLLLEASSVPSLRAVFAGFFVALSLLGIALLRHVRLVDSLRRELVTRRTGMGSVSEVEA